MKTCPHCGGEVRPSVITCVHCGTSLSGETEPAAVAAVGAPAPAQVGASEPLASGPVPASERPRPVPSTSVFAPAGGDVWVTPSGRADRHGGPSPGDLSELPVPFALRRRADRHLLVGGLLGLAAAVVTYTSLPLAWVTASITTVDDRLRTHVLAELTFRGSDAFAGKIGLGIAVALAVLGLVWFWYGLDRGATLPRLASPWYAALAAAVGSIVVAFAQFGFFFWDDAFVAHAREAGMTRKAMRTLLDAHPAPIVEVQQLSGVVRFGAGTALALVAGLVALWSQRRRD